VRESLTRLREQQWSNLEIIVSDNGSTDGTVAMIETEFPEVELLKMPKNMGIEAYNVAFANAHGEYIVILDDDSFPASNAVEKMVEKFENDPKLGIVAFDVRNYFSYDESAEADNKSSEKRAVAANYMMSFNGAGAGVRRSVMEEVGYYPEEFFLYWNEPDLAFRVWDAGYKVEFFSDIVSYHKYSPKNRASWRAPFFYTRNAFWLIWKNYPIKYLVPKTFELLWHVFYHSLEQKTTIYIQGLFSAIFNIKQLAGKRKPVADHIAEGLRIPFEVSFTFFR
jgi:hypothetical protein